jgi:hypothetical protein
LVYAEGEFGVDPEEVAHLRAAFDVGGLDTFRRVVWKRPALPTGAGSSARIGLCLGTKRHEASAATWPATAPLIRSAARVADAQPEQIQEAFRAPPWRV